MSLKNQLARQHAREATSLPVEVTLDNRQTDQIDKDQITNVSLGGLCFVANQDVAIGTRVKVKFPILNQICGLAGKVVWCHKSNLKFEVGLEFEDPNQVQRLKTVEQIHHIEQFRKEVLSTEGRKITSEQAAFEWTNKYAGEFNAL